MASYHLSVKNIGRSSGRSAVASAAYRAREKLYDERQNRKFDYSKQEDLGHAEILTPSHAPEWMKDREKLWNGVEAAEKRKDSRLAKEVEVALPKELSLDQNKALLKEFVTQNFIKEGRIADIAIHTNEQNPHAHIMLTTREIVGDGFGKKVRGWDKKEHLLKWRKSWADIQNEHLLKHGFDINVDHRSHAERGIDIEPQKHLGPINNIEPEKAKKLDRMEEYNRIARENGQRIIDDPGIALDYLTQHHATFTRSDIDRFVNSHTFDEDQFYQAKYAIESSFNIVRLGVDEKGVSRYTTLEMLEIERQAFDHVDTLNQKETHGVDKHYITQAIDTRTLTEEQENALRKLTSGNDISCMIGKAGTGKSYTLDALRESYESQGYNVKGCALSGIAAEGLQGSSGIESKTIHRTLWDLENGRGKLDRKSILVVDEAGMVGTRQMHKILQHVNDAGAKLILVGDHHQLQPIEAGGVFRGIVDKVGAVELSEIRRQEKEWQKEATTLLSGDKEKIGQALSMYKAHGNMTETENLKDAKDQLIKDWAQDYDPEKSKMILAYLKKDVRDLNEKAREELKKSGVIDKEYTFETENGSRAFSKNDRIFFLQNEYSLDVRNGTLGTIDAIDQHHISVKLDNGDHVVFDPKMYDRFDHGYAATVHKNQGVTVDNAYVLGSAHFDKHLTYVALSRHREDVNIYTSKDKVGFRDFDRMQDIMGRDRSKELIYQYASYKDIEVDIGKGHLFTPELFFKEDRERLFDDIIKTDIPFEKVMSDLLPKSIEELEKDIEHVSIKDVERDLHAEVDDFSLALSDIVNGMTIDDRKDELERFKSEINLSEYAACCGYKLDTKETFQNSVMMQSESDKIRIRKDEDGHYVYSSQYNSDKRGSVIDFIQQQTDYNMGEVRKELRPWLDEETKPSVDQTCYQKKIVPLDKDRETALKHFQGCYKVTGHEYLESKRHIDNAIIKDRRFDGKIFIDDRWNLVFPLVDRKGISDLELHNKDFAKAGEKGLWVSHIDKKDTRLVITESPINALSYHQLKKEDHTRYLSTGNQMSDHQKDLLKSAVGRMPAGSTVIIATNREEVGAKLTEQIRGLVSRKDIKLVRETPKEKDWNGDLARLKDPEYQSIQQRKEKQVQSEQEYNRYRHRVLNGKDTLWRAQHDRGDRTIRVFGSPKEAIEQIYDCKKRGKDISHVRYIALVDNMSDNQKALLKNELERVPNVEIATSREKDTKFIMEMVHHRKYNPILDKKIFDDLEREEKRQKAIQLQKENRQLVEKKIKTLKTSCYQEYLIGRDCNLHYTTLDSQRFRSQILADKKFETAYFPQRSGKEVTNLEIYDKEIKKTLVNDKSGLWHSNYGKADKRLVVTSTPIEALSHYELYEENCKHTRYIAMTDNMSEKQKALLKAEMKKASEVELSISRHKDMKVLKELVYGQKYSKEHGNEPLNKDLEKQIKDDIKKIRVHSIEKSTSLNQMLKNEKSISKGKEMEMSM